MNYTRNWLLLLLWSLIIGWVFKPIFIRNVPIPLDVMVGGYFPWLDYKWGYAAGVPYKNASLTDVFSQLYPWRALAIDTLRHGRLPLWNPLSLAGMPLLANWQSAPLYPLNILMMMLGNVWGWSVMVILEPFLAGVFFYLMLRVHKIPKLPAFGGGVMFALSGFMMTYLEYNTTGQIFMWVPVLIMIAKRNKALWFAPWVIFYILCGGFFQPAIYALAVALVYWLISGVGWKKTMIYFSLGILLSAIQLIPTFELLNLSIRNYDPNITNYNFGLIPAKQLITLLVPDFFGNPATGNYFGFMGYQETTGYAGILAIVLIWGALKTKKSSLKTTALLSLGIGLVLAFDNPISRLVYQLKIPLISTGYASRNLLFLSFSLAVLTALGLTNLNSHRKSSMVVMSILGGMLLGYFVVLKILPIEISKNYSVTFRNLVFPIIIITVINLINFININNKIKTWLFLGVIIFDLGRFAIKFLPFSKAEFANLKIPSIEFLQNNSVGYRIERDDGSLPPNTWIYFGLPSPSGYDPLMPLDYSKLLKNNFSRYAEINGWDSPLLDLLGVKYVLTTKKIKGVIDKNGADAGYKFDKKRWSQVFTDNISLVLENKNVLPSELRYVNYELRMGDDKFDITNFRNKIILEEEPKLDPKVQDLMLINDTYYPGWRAYVNGKETKIYRAFGALRAIVVPKGNVNVRFVYFPASFAWGASLTFLTIGLLGIMKWRQVQSE